jgi:hypothetical protein
VPDFQAQLVFQIDYALTIAQCALVAATLIQHAILPQHNEPKVADHAHLERLDDVVGV